MTTGAKTRNRQPKGVSTGGRYAAENRPEPPSGQLAGVRSGPVDRLAVLAGFAEGEVPAPVFGPEREPTAKRISGWVRGIQPTEDERMQAAFGHGNDRKVRAYDNGVQHLKNAYYEYGHLYGDPG